MQNQFLPVKCPLSGSLLTGTRFALTSFDEQILRLAFLILHFADRRFFRAKGFRVIKMPHESTNINCDQSPSAPTSDTLNLLDVMEICSHMCLSEMLAAQILEGADLSEVCNQKLADEIALLKVSPFGKRLTQIH